MVNYDHLNINRSLLTINGELLTPVSTIIFWKNNSTKIVNISRSPLTINH